MSLLVKIVGIAIVIMGITFFVNTQLIAQVLNYIKEGKRIYGAGVVRIVIGVILLVSAAQCRLTWAIVVIGLLLVVAGAAVFVLGLDKCRGFIDKFQAKPANVLRMMMLIPVVIGVLIILSA